MFPYMKALKKEERGGNENFFQRSSIKFLIVKSSIIPSHKCYSNEAIFFIYFTFVFSTSFALIFFDNFIWDLSSAAQQI